MSAVDTEFYKKKKSSTFYVGVVFLVLTVLWTWGLYLFTESVHTENQQIMSDTEIIDTAIANERSDNAVQVYSIYQQHKPLLEKLAKDSQIPLFASHLKKNFLKYGMDGEWFNYSAWEVQLKMTSKTDDRGYAYQKVVRLLDEYNQDEKALFNIWPVSKFAWHDQMTYDINFTLK